MSSRDDARRGQINTGAAEVYDAFFVPALFDQWPGRILEAAEVSPGHRVVDVACGTGVLAAAAAARVGTPGDVAGVDVNEGMLAVAARRAPGIRWERGRAEALPFDDAAFDKAVSQFGLMFFDDRAAAIREMARVTRPWGRVAVAVWGALGTSPGYAAMVGLLDRLFGAEAADALRVPFALGDPGVLAQVFADAGVHDLVIRTLPGVARFPSIADWVRTDIRGWTLADMIDDEGLALLLRVAEDELARFTAEDGAVSFPAPAHVAVFDRV